MRLAVIRREKIAVELIRRGMRLSVVSQITGFTPKVLRALSREIHDRKAQCGQLPSTSRILSKRATHATATLFAALYLALAGPRIREVIVLSALLKAHDLYLEFSANLNRQGLEVEPVDITQAWILARDIRTGIACFLYCRSCQIHYLFTDDSRVPGNCPVCTLKKQYAS